MPATVQPMSVDSLHIGFDISQTGSKKTGCGYYAYGMLQALFALAPDMKFSLYPSFGAYFFDPLMPLRNPYGRGVYGPRHLTRQAAAEFWQNPDLEAHIQQPDIIHANNFWCPIQLKNTRLICTLHDLGFMTNPEWCTEMNRVISFEGMFRSAIQADWIVAVSEASKAHYLELFPHFPAERIVVIYPCSRYTNVDSTGKKPKALGNIAAGKFWLSVGTIEPRKNQKMLAKAYAQYLATGGEPMPLVFAGAKGWLMDDFKTTIAALGIASQVIFTNYVSDEELIWLYRSCYAHIYPSFFEGFGLPVLEGMQFGAPTVTSNTTSLREVGAEGAILLSPECVDAWTKTMQNLARHPAARTALGESAQQRARAFSWQSSAKQLIELYRKAISYPKRTTAELGRSLS